jgi:hypothetical protein
MRRSWGVGWGGRWSIEKARSKRGPEYNMEKGRTKRREGRTCRSSVLEVTVLTPKLFFL